MITSENAPNAEHSRPVGAARRNANQSTKWPADLDNQEVVRYEPCRGCIRTKPKKKVAHTVPPRISSDAPQHFPLNLPTVTGRVLDFFRPSLAFSAGRRPSLPRNPLSRGRFQNGKLHHPRPLTSINRRDPAPVSFVPGQTRREGHRVCQQGLILSSSPHTLATVGGTCTRRCRGLTVITHFGAALGLRSSGSLRWRGYLLYNLKSQ